MVMLLSYYCSYVAELLLWLCCLAITVVMLLRYYGVVMLLSYYCGYVA